MVAISHGNFSWGNNYTTAATTYTLDYNIGNFGALTISPPKPRTNLDWLDERVNEMRVKL